jgi:hypothetical protein
MKALLVSDNGVYKVELDNGSTYWCKPDEKRDDFLTRAGEAIFSDFKVRVVIEDLTYFGEARAQAVHHIATIKHELGRMGRAIGRKPAHKDALQKLVEIIDLYNEGKYELINGK